MASPSVAPSRKLGEAGAQRRHVHCERQVQVIVAVGAPALGGSGRGTKVGGGVDAGVHPGGVVQSGEEEAVGDGEPTVDGVAA